MEAYFNEFSELIWLGIGFALIFIELSIAPGIGLLFAGMAGITLGGLLAFDLIDPPDFAEQLVYFCVLTISWTLVLWKPLKKYLGSAGSFDMYKGTTAFVLEKPLTKSKTGMVRWSGSHMRAKIRAESETQEIAMDEEVYIHDMVNGIMFVDTVPVPSVK